MPRFHGNSLHSEGYWLSQRHPYRAVVQYQHVPQGIPPYIAMSGLRYVAVDGIDSEIWNIAHHTPPTAKTDFLHAGGKLAAVANLVLTQAFLDTVEVIDKAFQPDTQNSDGSVGMKKIFSGQVEVIIEQATSFEAFSDQSSLLPLGSSLSSAFCLWVDQFSGPSILACHLPDLAIVSSVGLWPPGPSPDLTKKP